MTIGPGLKTWVRYTFYQAERLPLYQLHKVEGSRVCVEDRGRISRSGLTQGWVVMYFSVTSRFHING